MLSIDQDPASITRLSFNSRAAMLQEFSMALARNSVLAQDRYQQDHRRQQHRSAP